MKLRLAAAVPLLLLLAACSSGTGDDTDSTATNSTTSETSEADGLNARGAVEVALGETATVIRDGVTVLEVSGTALSTDGCAANTTLPDEITKQALSATVTVGPETITQWLWPSDFYYVDDAGKIAKNIDTSDATACTSATSSFIDMPANASADGIVTLDVPNAARVIGYHTTQGGQDIRIEWTLPDIAPTTTTSSAEEPTGQQPPATDEQPAPGAPPVGYTGAPNGPPQPLVGKVVDYCMTDPMYQTGTTMFTDGTTGWTQECAAE